jgi:hypothetical protein
MTRRSVGDVIADRYEIKGEPRDFPGYTAYRAFDREVEVEVALWWIRPELYPDAPSRAEFLRAAGKARTMKNPNARRMFGAGELDGGLFATVQLATGESLFDKLRNAERVSDHDLLQCAITLCEALGRAHQNGHVHCRLVPADVVYVSGLLKIGGIGLWGGASVAAERVWGDAARYVAPEAWSDAGLGPRADVFSAAVILAELACGGGEAWRQTGDVRELKDEVSLSRPDVAGELMDALELDPSRRTRSMGTLLEALRGALADDPVPTGRQAAVSVSDLDIGAASEHEPELETNPVAGPVAVVTIEADEPPPGGNGVGEAPPPIPAAPPPIPAAPPPIPTARRATDAIRAIDQEVDEAEDTRHYIGAAPAAAGSDFPDSELIEPPAPPSGPPVRKTGEALPFPLPAGAPSGIMRVPPAMPDEDLATSPRHPAVPSTPAPAAPAARPSRGLLPYLITGCAAALGVAVIVWVVLSNFLGDDGESHAGAPSSAAQTATTRAPATAPPVATRANAAEAVVVTPAPQTGPCPEAMVNVEGFCIDAYESPGSGRLPETGMTLARAQKTCADRGARLCAPDEWERACRGPSGSSFPYGSTYRKGHCNTPKDNSAPVAAAGSFGECRGDEGVYDMSGNVAEWVSDGRARGGSAEDRTDGRCSRRRKLKADRSDSDVGFRCCADAR